MKNIFMLAFISLIFYSCSNKTSDENRLVIYSPHALDFVEPLIKDFEEKNPNIKTELIAAGTGELIKRVETEQNTPLGDILWGANLNLIKDKLNLFEDYISTNENSLYDEYKNKEGSITRFTTIPSILIVNTNLTKDIKIEGYADLLNPALKGKIAYTDPSLSSSSFKHLINMLYAMGEGNPENGWEYVEKFVYNLDGKLLSGSSAVYKGVADSEYAVGLTFENAAANYAASGSPVKLVYMKEGVIMKADGIYIIKNAKHLENAKKFVDYITSYDAQKKMNEELNARAIRKDLPKSNILLPIEEIKVIHDNDEIVNKNKDTWLSKFKDIITTI
ncbi:ABC transporter substrate-binding protein [Brachyspira innocens]|uniref:ABC transporter substrate-binding protein n=1 Tax=Brachyspira innocens TaxID=13264 RepID=A0ABT8YYV2_9SPIR|nr:ABC transporter substrate-binding protein [Brachyspira innocens]MDO6994317.1 ABC transporter substrate-binding protein [Brachyspira innocens]MDO7020329.1 ABC transporter substrate-binding protein [Brachyspira innocens]